MSGPPCSYVTSPRYLRDISEILSEAPGRSTSRTLVQQSSLQQSSLQQSAQGTPQRCATYRPGLSRRRLLLWVQEQSSTLLAAARGQHQSGEGTLQYTDYPVDAELGLRPPGWTAEGSRGNDIYSTWRAQCEYVVNVAHPAWPYTPLDAHTRGGRALSTIGVLCWRCLFRTA